VPGGQGGRKGLKRGQKGKAKAPSSKPTESTLSTESTPPAPDEAAANAALVLIRVASALLGRQLDTLAEAFQREGGFSERLYRLRRRNPGAS
jgi:four helix bundle suffix protein